MDLRKELFWVGREEEKRESTGMSGEEERNGMGAFLLVRMISSDSVVNADGNGRGVTAFSKESDLGWGIRLC